MEDSGIVGKYYLCQPERSRIAAFAAILRSPETLAFSFCEPNQSFQRKMPRSYSPLRGKTGALLFQLAFTADRSSRDS
jgi:hypothetical protein